MLRSVMAAWHIGGSVSGARFRRTGVCLCAAVLLLGLCLMGAGVRAAQQPPAAGGRQATDSQNSNQKSDDSQPVQPNAQSTDSPPTQLDGADELLKEFPADSASKSATDPRDGHP